MAKTSLEYIPEGPSHLGAVVTNNGYSDWSTQDYPTEAAKQQLRFRIIRKSGDYTIYVKKGYQWEQIRIAHLMEDIGKEPVKIGFTRVVLLKIRDLRLSFTFYN